MGQKRVEEKTNEIKAIPELLDCLNIKGTIMAMDAMGTQTEKEKTEKRGNWQTNYISWLSRKKEWPVLKTIILIHNAVMGKAGETSTKEKYFISSLPEGIEEAVHAVRGHWIVESYQWHLDLTFQEDGNHTIEKQSAYKFITFIRCVGLVVKHIYAFIVGFSTIVIVVLLIS